MEVLKVKLTHIYVLEAKFSSLYSGLTGRRQRACCIVMGISGLGMGEGGML